MLMFESAACWKTASMPCTSAADVMSSQYSQLLLMTSTPSFTMRFTTDWKLRPKPRNGESYTTTLAPGATVSTDRMSSSTSPCCGPGATPPFRCTLVTCAFIAAGRPANVRKSATSCGSNPSNSTSPTVCPNPFTSSQLVGGGSPLAVLPEPFCGGFVLPYRQKFVAPVLPNAAVFSSMHFFSWSAFHCS